MQGEETEDKLKCVAVVINQSLKEDFTHHHLVCEQHPTTPLWFGTWLRVSESSHIFTIPRAMSSAIEVFSTLNLVVRALTGFPQFDGVAEIQYSTVQCKVAVLD
jgi:hypothetical protein